jgi:hypothetical protein
VQRQRLKALLPELTLLGLHQHRDLGALTLPELRAARTKRAKAVHPDVNPRGATLPSPAAAPPPAEPRGFFGAVFGSLFGAPSPSRSSSSSSDGARDAMAELNTAYDAVRHALTTGVYTAPDSKTLG